MTFKEQALAYARHGLAVFPLKPRDKTPITAHGVKDATRAENQIEDWWNERPDANVGIACGQPSGVVVLDIDGEAGEESLAVLAERGIALPRTPTVGTGKGAHLYFRAPEKSVGNRAGMMPGLDLRGDGGYVVAPASIHPTGRVYEWLVEWTEPFAELPDFLVELAAKSVSQDIHIEGPIPKGRRNDTAFRQASAMRRLGAPVEAIEAALLADTRYDWNAQERQHEVPRIAKNAAGYKPDTAAIKDEEFREREAQKRAAKAQVEAEVDAEYTPGKRMSEVQPIATRWLWKPYIPAGKLVILDGDPGLGKSTLLLDLAARWSRGDANPDGTMNEWGEEFTSIVISVEDSLEGTVQPRLVAQRADLSRIVAIEDIRPRPGEEFGVEIVKHMRYIRNTIEREQARFLIVDPLMAVLDETVDTHRDQAIRSQVMAPLRKLAEETGCTIAFVRHFNKLSGNAAIYRGGGSIGIIGAARSAMIVARNPADAEGEETRVFAHAKSNLARSGVSWVYHIEDGDEVGTLRWDGVSKFTADQLVMEDLKDAPKRAEAIKFIRDMLANGPMAQADIKTAVNGEDDLKWSTVEAAASTLERSGILKRSGGGNYGGPKTWKLKGQEEIDV